MCVYYVCVWFRALCVFMRVRLVSVHGEPCLFEFARRVDGVRLGRRLFVYRLLITSMALIGHNESDLFWGNN